MKTIYLFLSAFLLATLTTVTAQTNSIAPLPLVTLRVAASNAISESGITNAAIIARETTNITSSLTVRYSIGGGASNGVDYVNVPGEVTIPAGAHNIRVPLVAIDDVMAEPTENLILTLRPSETYRTNSVAYKITVPILDNDNAVPTVHLFSPTNHSVLVGPTNILLKAEARDSDGWLRRVEFYRNNVLIGSVTNQNTALYQLTWFNAQPGSYSLTAKAVDNLEAKGVSAPVNINVVAAQEPQPIVSIVATDSEAIEVSPIATVINTAAFTISRRENTNVAITVNYRISGTASNGLDYMEIPNSVHLPAGKVATNILIRPIDDTLVEGNETVSITLEEPVCIAVFPPPPECYIVGDLKHASAVIFDNDHVTNQPPVVQLLSPTNNAVLVAPANIPIEATASDPDGEISYVSFHVGEQFIGSRKTPPYSIVWNNVAPGTYFVRAKAVDDKGASRFTESSKVIVRSLAESAFVHRKLPLWYVPGVKVRVHLRAEPRTNTVSYVVHDTPPEGWTIQPIEQGTVNSGRITFGPFNDTKPRTFVYDVIAAGSGEKRFKGEAIANEISSPIIGATVLVPAPPHPADTDPSKWTFSAEEVEKYAFAWKHCERWPIAPNPIPVNYVTRAGFLFADADHYRLSTQFPTPVPPMIWIPASVETTSLLGANEPWATNRLATAIASMPTNYLVGVPFTVSIAVTPGETVKAYALEEAPPVGFAVTNVTGNGVFCRETRKIRWGLFSDTEPRTFSYQLVASTNSPNIARFHGVISCNGINQPVTGRRETKRATNLTAARLDGVKTLSDGSRLLTFAGEAGVNYVLEASSDLLDWQPIAELLNSDGNLQYIDPSTNELNKFYRAVPRE